MVALGITYFANNSCYYLLELEGYEIDNLKVQISFHLRVRCFLTIINFSLKTILGVVMSVARITTVTFESNEAADIAAAAYVPNAPSDFPEAEQLIAVKSEGNVNISVTLYENNEAMERATAAKNKVMDAIQGIVSVDTKVGSVILDHSN